ncbi:hypothetical protein DZK25_10515 [Wenzhouxiangella sp. 15181]|nr:hypothetical protein DZK25_10515 [Wenzhouxiangella sp. 15181]RFP69533.1 hypothetical protein DZK26_04005 [Wenzhouxiangella sp. 15190]
MGVMDKPTSARERPKALNFLFCALAIVLVLLSPALGVMAAAIATWHALLAGSFWYMPLGLVMTLAAFAMVQSHRLFDLAFLGLMVVAAITWFGLDSPQQRSLLEAVQALASQTYLMAGVLLVMLVAGVLIHIARGANRW